MQFIIVDILLDCLRQSDLILLLFYRIEVLLKRQDALLGGEQLGSKAPGIVIQARV